jgi:signal transduction histidine kinase
MRADPAMLRRALDNLVQNALRATPAEGEIQIMATRAPGRLRIDITDTGPGIDSGIRATLFEPFVTTRADGTGLGLAIAREMVQAHGGTLTLQSGAGGAHFTIELRQTGAVA